MGNEAHCRTKAANIALLAILWLNHDTTHSYTATVGI
jgi:hypothetical protein